MEDKGEVQGSTSSVSPTPDCHREDGPLTVFLPSLVKQLDNSSSVSDLHTSADLRAALTSPVRGYKSYNHNKGRGYRIKLYHISKSLKIH